MKRASSTSTGPLAKRLRSNIPLRRAVAANNVDLVTAYLAEGYTFDGQIYLEETDAKLQRLGIDSSYWWPIEMYIMFKCCMPIIQLAINHGVTWESPHRYYTFLCVLYHHPSLVLFVNKENKLVPWLVGPPEVACPGARDVSVAYPAPLITKSTKASIYLEILLANARSDSWRVNDKDFCWIIALNDIYIARMLVQHCGQSLISNDVLNYAFTARRWEIFIYLVQASKRRDLLDRWPSASKHKFAFKDMMCSAEQTPWSPQNHHLYSRKNRAVVQTCMSIRQCAEAKNHWAAIPFEIASMIFTAAMVWPAPNVEIDKQHELAKSISEDDFESVQACLRMGANPTFAIPDSDKFMKRDSQKLSEVVAIHHERFTKVDFIFYAIALGRFQIVKLLLDSLVVNCSDSCAILFYLRICILLGHSSFDWIRAFGGDSTTFHSARCSKDTPKDNHCTCPHWLYARVPCWRCKKAKCYCWRCLVRRIPVFDQPSKNSAVVTILLSKCSCVEHSAYDSWCEETFALVNDVYIARLFIGKYQSFHRTNDYLSSLVEYQREQLLEMFYLNYREPSDFLCNGFYYDFDFHFRPAGQFFRDFLSNAGGKRDWDFVRHYLFPSRVKQAILTFVSCMLLRSNERASEESDWWPLLPNELLWIIFAEAFRPLAMESTDLEDPQ